MEEIERYRADGNPTSPLVGAAFDAVAQRVRVATGGTTHISVCDGEGNAASLSLSNGEGSGYIVPETGIMLNNMLGEDDLHPKGFEWSPPGRRVASTMSPCILLRDGEVVLIVGSGGSKRIRTTLVQVLTAVVDFSKSVREAVDAPRIHWDGEMVQVEPAVRFGRASSAAILYTVAHAIYGNQPSCERVPRRRRRGDRGQTLLRRSSVCRLGRKPRPMEKIRRAPIGACCAPIEYVRA